MIRYYFDLQWDRVRDSLPVRKMSRTVSGGVEQRRRAASCKTAAREIRPLSGALHAQRDERSIRDPPGDSDSARAAGSARITERLRARSHTRRPAHTRTRRGKHIIPTGIRSVQFVSTGPSSGLPARTIPVVRNQRTPCIEALARINISPHRNSRQVDKLVIHHSDRCCPLLSNRGALHRSNSRPSRVSL